MFRDLFVDNHDHDQMDDYTQNGNAGDDVDYNEHDYAFTSSPCLGDDYYGSISSEIFSVGCSTSGITSHSALITSSFTGTGSLLQRSLCGPVMGLGRNRQTVLSCQNKADFTALELELGSPKFANDYTAASRRKVEPWCVPICVMGFLILLIIFLPFTTEKLLPGGHAICNTNCRIDLVESIPKYLESKMELPSHMGRLDTWSYWLKLIELADRSIEIVSPSEDPFPFDMLGNTSSHIEKSGEYEILHRSLEIQKILNALAGAASQRNVRIRIIHSSLAGNVSVGATNSRPINTVNVHFHQGLQVQFREGLRLGAGLWIVDNQHFYLGSANLGRPQAQKPVFDMGIIGIDCACMTSDLSKLFNSLWHMSSNTRGTSSRSSSVVNPIIVDEKAATGISTAYRSSNIPDNLSKPVTLIVPRESIVDPVFTVLFPASTAVLNETASVFGSSRSSTGRSCELEELLNFVHRAQTSLDMVLMQYNPSRTNFGENSTSLYWPLVDASIRQALLDRKVKLRILVNKQSHVGQETTGFTITHLCSLAALHGLISDNDVQIRWFEPKLERSPATTSGNSQRTVHRRARERDDRGAVHLHRNYMISESGIFFGAVSVHGDDFFHGTGASITINRLLEGKRSRNKEDLINHTPQPATSSKTSSDGRENHEDTVITENTPTSKIATRMRVHEKLQQVFQRDWSSKYASHFSFEQSCFRNSRKI